VSRRVDSISSIADIIPVCQYHCDDFVRSAGLVYLAMLYQLTSACSVAPSQSGVAGALLQVSLQLGAVLSLSVQAGLLGRKPGSFSNYANVQASFWFQAGWCLFNLIIFLAFFRPGKAAAGSEVAQAAEETKEV
jgi:hypothetical protein